MTTQFIHSENNGEQYAKTQAIAWRTMGYSVKSEKFEGGIMLYIVKKDKYLKRSHSRNVHVS